MEAAGRLAAERTDHPDEPVTGTDTFGAIFRYDYCVRSTRDQACLETAAEWLEGIEGQERLAEIVRAVANGGTVTDAELARTRRFFLEGIGSRVLTPELVPEPEAQGSSPRTDAVS